MIWSIENQKEKNFGQTKGSSSHGFTLLELIMSVSIMAILFSVGYANFRGSQRRKNLERGVLKLESDLLLARQYALSGRVDACTGGLEGYSFDVISSTSYQIVEVCMLGATNQTKLENTLFNDLGLTLSVTAGPDPVHFRVLGHGLFDVDGYGVTGVTYSITDGTETRTVTVDQGGDVNYQ